MAVHDLSSKQPDDAKYLDVPLLGDYRADVDPPSQGTKPEEQVVFADEKGTSFLRTCFNGLNALSGVGILSIPYALSQGGWWSLILLVIVAMMCCYTGLLLQRCMGAATHINTYPDIGELAFGRVGRLAISFFMYLELYLVAIEFLILEGDNLDNLFPNASLDLGIVTLEGKQLFVIAAALVILPTTWMRNLGVLAFLSAGGVLASVAVVLSVLYVGAFNNVGFNKRGVAFNLSGLPTALGMYSFCYCGHAVFPTICTSMKKKSQFSKVLLVCFILCTLSYGSMAVFGYLMYGEDVKSQITLNLPKGSISSNIAIYTIILNPLTKFALMITPIANAIESRYMVSNSMSTSITIRTLIMGSLVVVALTVPFFAYLMALTGSFLSIIVSILLPCLFYLKIFGISRGQTFDLVIIVVVLIFSTFIGVTGTYSSLRKILNCL